MLCDFVTQHLLMGKSLLLGLALALSFLAFAAAPAYAHRDPCHSRHECPSEHATYRWQGLLCVKSPAPKRAAGFKVRVTYGGLTYYCKR